MNEEPRKHSSVSLLASLALSIAIVAALLILTEIVSRTDWVQDRFPLRSVGNYHSQFEIKWFKLQDYVEQNGGVDVILMGNSMVNTGIDPEVLATTYEASTGIPLRVFNFGVEGLTVSPNSRLAQLLVETYHPKTILYFTEMRDYVPENGIEEENNFLDNAWLAYRFGESNFTGWLVDHSSALQIMLSFRGWTRPDFLDSYILNVRRETLTNANGYEPETRIREDIDVRPDPTSEADKPFFELYQNFSINPSRQENLHTIISQQDAGTNVLVTEIPVFFTFYDYFGGESVHEQYLSDINQIISDYGGTFVAPIDADLIPLDGRADRLHLNTMGAEVYSELLAEELSVLCNEQMLCLDRYAQ